VGTIVFEAGSKALIGNSLLGTDGIYNGLIAGAGFAQETEGIVTVTVDKLGGFSGKGFLGGKALPGFRGTFANGLAPAPLRWSRRRDFHSA